MKRKLALVLTVSLLLSTLAACANQPGTGSAAGTSGAAGSSGSTESSATAEDPAKAPIQLSMGGYGVGVVESDIGNIPQVDFFQEKFGIELDVVPNLQDDDKSNAAIAANDIPDLFITPKRNLESLIPGKMIQPLDAYITPEATPNIYRYAEAALDFSKQYYSDGSQSLYVVPSRVNTGAPAFLINPFIRWDYYQEIGAPVVNSFDELIDVMLAVRELHPANENGEAYYGMGMSMQSRIWSYCVPFGFMFEGKSYRGDQFMDYDIVTDTFSTLISNEDSSLWNGVRMLNKMQRSGLLDPELFTMTDQLLVDRTAQDRYLITDLSWFRDMASAGIKENGVDTELVPLCVGPDTAWLSTYEEPVGSVAYLWSVSSRVPEEALGRIAELFDYCYTPEGCRNLLYGLEGVAWETAADGKARLTEQYRADRTNMSISDSYGANKFSGLMGLGPQYRLEEGGQYIDVTLDADSITEYYTDVEKEYCAHFGLKTMFDPIVASRGYTESSIVGNMIPAVTTDQSRAWSTMENHLVTSLPNLILSSNTDEELEQGRQKLVEDLRGMGLDEFEGYWVEEFQKAQAIEKDILSK